MAVSVVLKRAKGRALLIIAEGLQAAENNRSMNVDNLMRIISFLWPTLHYFLPPACLLRLTPICRVAAFASSINFSAPSTSACVICLPLSS